MYFIATYVYSDRTSTHVIYVYVYAHMKCATCRSFYAKKKQKKQWFKSSRHYSHPPWRQQRVSYVLADIHGNANACQRCYPYWRDFVIQNELPYMMFHVHDTIDICRGEDDIGDYIFPSHRIVAKTTPKIIISQNLISKTNMISPITFSRPTKCQPKQRLQLQFHKMQCPRHFFIGSKCHPTSTTNSTKCNVHVISLWGPSVTPR